MAEGITIELPPNQPMESWADSFYPLTGLDEDQTEVYVNGRLVPRDGPDLYSMGS